MIMKKIEAIIRVSQFEEVTEALHDIGMIALPDSILRKNEAPDENEIEQIRKHAEMGVTMIEPVDFLKDSIQVVRHHHEHFDGSGFPDGLAGEDIPILARLVNVVNVFDVWTTQPMFGSPVKVEDAVKKLEDGKGSSFDPAIVDAFMVIVQKIVARIPKRGDADVGNG